jgi:hypothetical protein
MKADNVAHTGLTWNRGEILEIEDEAKAIKLLEHPHVWADADTDYKMLEVPAEEVAAPEPCAMIIPEGGDEVSLYWDPITIVVPATVFKSLQEKETIAVFMKPEEADAYQAYKAANAFDPVSADKRSKAYKEWAADHPDEAKKLLEAA